MLAAQTNKSVIDIHMYAIYGCRSSFDGGATEAASARGDGGRASFGRAVKRPRWTVDSFRPWPCRGRAEEKPLDSLTAVTGAQGRGSIVVCVGIFAGVIGIIASVAGVTMLDSEGRV